MTIWSLISSGFVPVQGAWFFGMMSACAGPARGAGLPSLTRSRDFGRSKRSSECSVIHMPD